MMVALLEYIMSPAAFTMVLFHLVFVVNFFFFLIL